MRRLTIVALATAVTVLSSSGITGQNGSLRVTVPSPTAASLGKFGDIPVNLYSGIPDITVPLFTAQGKTLQVPIAIRYHAGGIRVEEIASWVGLGWSLEAGGAITRTVRGEVDESQTGYYNTGNTFYQGTNWSNPPTTLLENIRDGFVDGDPDQFFFSFLGRSGQFVIGPASTSATIKEHRPVPFQKIRIVPTIVSDEITKFDVTAEDGVQYTFAAKETSTDQSAMSPPPGDLGSHLNETHASAWHLTKIRAPGGDSVTLHYSTHQPTHRQGRYREVFTHVVSNPQLPACVPSQVDVTNEYDYTVQRLDSIKTAAHTIRFITDTQLRQDALAPGGGQQERRLQKIIVSTPSGTVIRQFVLKHNYFSGPDGGRLRLDAVFELNANNDSLPPHSFTYNSAALPSRTSYAQDHWGYYNGKTNSSPIPTVLGPGGLPMAGADREPDPAYMQIGMLTRITYPTGGSNEFVYESNDYGAIGTGGVMPLGFGPEQQVFQNSFGGVGPFTEPFVVGGTEPTIVRVVADQSPSDCGGQEFPPCPFTAIKQGGATVGGPWDEGGTFYLELSPGSYTAVASDEFNSAGSADITVYWRDRAYTKKKTAGGLRVAQIRTVDTMGDTIIRRYEYTLLSDTTRSSGVVSNEPRYTHEFESSGCDFFSRASASKLPLGEGSPVGYREVTVWQGSSGQFGKTRHSFRSAIEVEDTEPIGSPYLRRTSYEWMRGQEVESSEYNGSAQLQTQTVLTYAFLKNPTPSPETVTRFKGISLHAVAGDCEDCFSYTYNPFEVVSGWTYQDGETTTFYNETGGGSFATTREFSYDNPAHAQLTKIVETGSDGRQRITRMKYPADFPTGSGNPEASALTAMQGSAHMHSPVIERLVIEKVGSTETILEAVLTTFKLFGTGQYLPYQRFVINIPGALP